MFSSNKIQSKLVFDSIQCSSNQVQTQFLKLDKNLNKPSHALWAKELQIHVDD